MSTAADDVLAANRKLLAAIDAGNWSAYAELCDESISCFEPEALGNLVEGLPFHKFYFDLPPGKTPKLSSIASPKVRLLGDSGAVVTYIRVVQKLDGTGAPVSVAAEETRVWQKHGSAWKHVHFHRTPLAH